MNDAGQTLICLTVLRVEWRREDAECSSKAFKTSENTRGGENVRFFDASRFSLGWLCLDADKLIIGILKLELVRPLQHSVRPLWFSAVHACTPNTHVRVVLAAIANTKRVRPSWLLWKLLYGTKSMTSFIALGLRPYSVVFRMWVFSDDIVHSRAKILNTISALLHWNSHTDALQWN